MSYKVPEMRRRKPCRFRNWTLRERKVVCNGCGGKGGWIDPPDLAFGVSCDHHDANYWIGGDCKDRLKADREFLAAMRRDVGRLPWWRKPLAYLAAWVYYRAVRRFGRSAFVYRDPGADLWAELENHMDVSGHYNV